MIIFKKSADLSSYLSTYRNQFGTIGYVPTMGALHTGHISLITNSVSLDKLTICSIFVNPTQFNNAMDFEKYPISIEKDIDLLEKSGCDILFLPLRGEIYPLGIKDLENYDLGYLETVLEGKYRPGHFQGVCQVVHRLLEIIRPGNLYIGQKDYQQCLVIRKLMELTGLQINLVVYPTMREKDGLALSSRNIRLTEMERVQAAKIYDTLCFIKKELKPGYLEDLKERASQYLSAEGFKVDYTEIADAATLETISSWDGKRKLVALVAAFINDIRLIDNMLLND